MQGRYGMYGVDKFSIFLLVVYAVFGISAAFVRATGVYIVLRVIQDAALVYWIYRFFSRKIGARQKENAWACRTFGSVGSFFKLQYNRVKDVKTHVYKKCPHCKAVLRLPRRKGKNSVKCPRCGNSFPVNNLF